MNYIDLVSQIPANKREQITSHPIFQLNDDSGTSATILSRDELTAILNKHEAVESWIIPVRQTSDDASAQYNQLIRLIELSMDAGLEAKSIFQVADIYNPKILLPAVMVFGTCENVMADLIFSAGIDFVVNIAISDEETDAELMHVAWQ